MYWDEAVFQSHFGLGLRKITLRTDHDDYIRSVESFQNLLDASARNSLVLKTICNQLKGICVSGFLNEFLYRNRLGYRRDGCLKGLLCCAHKNLLQTWSLEYAPFRMFSDYR